MARARPQSSQSLEPVAAESSSSFPTNVPQLAQASLGWFLAEERAVASSREGILAAAGRPWPSPSPSTSPSGRMWLLLQSGRPGSDRCPVWRRGILTRPRSGECHDSQVTDGNRVVRPALHLRQNPCCPATESCHGQGLGTARRGAPLAYSVEESSTLPPDWPLYPTWPHQHELPRSLEAYAHAAS